MCFLPGRMSLPENWGDKFLERCSIHIPCDRLDEKSKHQKAGGASLRTAFSTCLLRRRIRYPSFPDHDPRNRSTKMIPECSTIHIEFMSCLFMSCSCANTGNNAGKGFIFFQFPLDTVFALFQILLYFLFRSQRYAFIIRTSMDAEIIAFNCELISNKIMCIPCCICVSTSEVVVVERLGKFDRFIQPGLGIIFCPCEQQSGTVSVRTISFLR